MVYKYAYCAHAGLIARNRRWSWLGHVLRMAEHRLVRQVLLNCVRPTQETLFADVPNLNYRKRYKTCLRIGSYGVAIGPHCVANLYKGGVAMKVSKYSKTNYCVLIIFINVSFIFSFCSNIFPTNTKRSIPSSQFPLV